MKHLKTKVLHAKLLQAKISALEASYSKYRTQKTLDEILKLRNEYEELNSEIMSMA